MGECWVGLSAKRDILKEEIDALKEELEQKQFELDEVDEELYKFEMSEQNREYERSV